MSGRSDAEALGGLVPAAMGLFPIAFVTHTVVIVLLYLAGTTVLGIGLIIATLVRSPSRKQIVPTEPLAAS